MPRLAGHCFMQSMPCREIPFRQPPLPRTYFKPMPNQTYGSKGQSWHPEFVAYMDKIVEHPNYAGMPDAIKEDGRVQWEAPSNRSSGQFQHTHSRRLDWWRSKAASLGIAAGTNLWISITAKKIHPFGAKPCKRCGKVMEIRYAYLGKRIRSKMLKAGYEPAPDPAHILDVIKTLHETHGPRIMADLPSFFGSDYPKSGLTTIAQVLKWIDEVFIPSEPALLSPGCMANPPDRLDGFHSFNLCCRKRADKGRSDNNLSGYVTDRRVFEYWADGDWICADKMMGEVRANFRSEACLNGHPGPCDADHIGPISLGFAHNPHFQLLCGACNSAKNNRMSLEDVRSLISMESSGECVASWHAKPIWDKLKRSVTTDEAALRLSKIMRDNRHTYMRALSNFNTQGTLRFLISLLNLHFADREPAFQGLMAENHRMVFSGVLHEPRNNRYSLKQKIRRCRIALSSLESYFEKENRNAYFVDSDLMEESLEKAVGLVLSTDQDDGLDAELHAAIKSGDIDDGIVGRYLSAMPSEWPASFVEAKSVLVEGLEDVATKLSEMWDDERYVRDSAR